MRNEICSPGARTGDAGPLPTEGAMGEARLLRTNEVAERLGLRAQTLRLWRMRGIGPPWIRFSGGAGAALYREDEFVRWLRMHSRGSGGDRRPRRRRSTQT
ncbi:MAG: helix-turn-helix domain-containing protein [Acidobacteriota bacterium]